MKLLSNTWGRGVVLATAGAVFEGLYAVVFSTPLNASSVLVSAALSVIAGLGTCYLFESNKPGQRFSFYLKSIRGLSTQDVLIGVFRFVKENPTLCFILAALVLVKMSAPAVSALSDNGQLIYRATDRFGQVWLCAWLIWTACSTVIHSPESIGFMIIRVIESITLYVFALAFVQLFGDSIGELFPVVQANPHQAMSVVAALAILWIAFSFASSGSRFSRSAAYDAVSPGGVAVGFKEPLPRTDKAIHRTAIHEAGHLLTFACREDIPSDLAVSIKDSLSETDLYRGFVIHSELPREVMTKSFLEWSMMMNIAGYEAESLVFGDPADGSSGDFSKWSWTAKIYLFAGFGEVFYSVPTSYAEGEHDRRVLNDLKRTHLAQAREFLQVNRVVLDDLASEIANKKKLDREQLLPFLNRVVGTDAFPVRTGSLL